jgi:hypothetical protein
LPKPAIPLSATFSPVVVASATILSADLRASATPRPAPAYSVAVRMSVSISFSKTTSL